MAKSSNADIRQKSRLDGWRAAWIGSRPAGVAEMLDLFKSQIGGAITDLARWTGVVVAVG